MCGSFLRRNCHCGLLFIHFWWVCSPYTDICHFKSKFMYILLSHVNSLAFIYRFEFILHTCSVASPESTSRSSFSHPDLRPKRIRYRFLGRPPEPYDPRIDFPTRARVHHMIHRVTALPICLGSVNPDSLSDLVTDVISLSSSLSVAGLLSSLNPS